MPETPRRDQLSPHWRAILDDLEAKVEELCRKLERSRQARKTQRNRRHLEEARNLVLRGRVKPLEEQVRSLGGIARD